MSKKYMLLPANNFSSIKLLRIPEDLEEHEAFRHVTGLIADVEENKPNFNWEDLATVLEDHGFESVDFILGPVLD